MNLMDILPEDESITFEITSNDKEFTVSLIEFLRLSSTAEDKLTTVVLTNKSKIKERNN